jgi:hypothetical protein
VLSVAKIRSQPRCPFVDELDKENAMWHTMEYCSTIRKIVGLQAIITGEISQVQKDITCSPTWN